MLKSIPRIQDTIYMQIVFDHLLSRMGNRSKNAILQTEINTNFRKRVIKFPKLDSHSSQRYARIVHNSNIEKLIHASFSTRSSLIQKLTPPPLSIERNSARIHYEPFPIHLQSPPFHQLPSMEPFEKIHIRAHLHGSRAKPSRVDRPVQSGTFKRLANRLFNAILSLDLRPRANSSSSCLLRVSVQRKRKRENRGSFPTSGKRVKSGTKKQYQSANVAPK